MKATWWASFVASLRGKSPWGRWKKIKSLL